VPKPVLTFTSPAAGADVFGTIVVQLTADPERASHVVQIQRSLAGGSWQTLTTDSSSPVYSYRDDLSSVAVGTTIRYRGILDEPDGTRAVSAIRTVTRAAPLPLVNSVTIAGSLQTEIGCATDWNPACAESHLTFDTTDGLWKGTFPITPGTGYAYKVAINDSWTVNYGAGGALGGGNLTVDVPAGTSTITFIWDQVSHTVTHTLG
jgi:plastocyanin